MPRPVSMMSVALLTAVGAAAAGVLPQLVNVTGGQPTPTPVQNTMPPPVGIGTTATGGTASAPGSPVASSSTPAGSFKVNSLAPNPITFRRDGDGYVANLPLRSVSGCEQDVSWEAVGSQDREGDALNIKLDAPTPPTLKVPPFATVNIPLRLSLPKGAAAGSNQAGGVAQQNPLLPGKGWLRLLATPAQAAGEACQPAAPEPKREPPDPGYQHLPFLIPETPPDSAGPLRWIFFGTLGTAVLVLLISMSLLGKNPKVPLRGRMGSATWSFQQSWGSNVTIGAGILSAVVTAIAFPSHPEIMDWSSYTLLQSLFLAVIALAPLVYGLLRADEPSGGVPTSGPQGYVFMFLLAGTLVLWAALGQLATLGVLVAEFKEAGSLDAGLSWAFIILASGLFLLLLVYGVQALSRTPRRVGQAGAGGGELPPPPPPPQGAAVKEAVAGRARAKEVPTPQDWPLL